MKLSKSLLFFLTLLLTLPAAPQQARSNVAASASTVVPPLIPYSGVVNGKSATDVSITFLIYKDEQGGDPLFAETQAVALDAAGHYKAQLGATLTNGIPIDLFATGEARWLEVQAAGEAPQPRVLLVSVPYALKAADAATLGGLPASAFALAGSRPSAAAISPAITPDAATSVTTTGGVAGYLPEFSGASNIVDSPLFVSSAKVGIGTAAPLETLDVRGTAMASALIVNGVTTLGGALEIAPVSFNATPATGYNSQLLKLLTSAYNSTNKAIVNPRFVWQATVNGNNTAAPSATLELLSAATAAVATPTGFYFNQNGTINFAPGQTFPIKGTGGGTITGVTAGTALTGGGTSGNVTLNLDTTKVPLLEANNTFTGNLTATGTASAGTVNAVNGFDLGGSPFAFGSLEFQSVFLGFAGNSSNVGPAAGIANTAVGFKTLAANTAGYNSACGAQALVANTSGSYNTANGYLALVNNITGYQNVADGAQTLLQNTIGFLNTADGESALGNNTTGSYNTAVGDNALGNNTTGLDNIGVGSAAGGVLDSSFITGSGNTAVGAGAGFATGSINNSTAVGHLAEVGESNALVLGCIAGINDCPNSVRIGIGTATPRSVLEASASVSGALGPSLTLTNTAGGLNAAASIDFNTYYHSAVPYKNPTSRIEALDDNAYGNTLAFLSKLDGADTNGLVVNMTISDNGDVAIRGSLSAAAKDFKIDHPVDPANKYLVHASVESSEMMNIYSGNVTTDELGLATIKLPDWFEAENTDFRYQLTVIGQFAQAIIKNKIANGQFMIMTNASHVEVSWQVTAVRQDAYAKANPLVVEQPKPEKERGSYIHPELYGQPAERQVDRVAIRK